MVVIEMEVKCPVAKCDYTVRGSKDGFKHFQNYDDLHKKLHWNWLKYFYPDLANSDWSDEVKYRFAYKEWHKQQKTLAMKKKSTGSSNLDGKNTEIKNGKYIIDGEKYTQEQFNNMQKGIKYMSVKIKKEERYK